MVTSVSSCRTGEVEGVGTVELVCVGGLLRMDGESLLLPVWRSVGGGFIGKGELDAWVVRAVTWWPGNLHGMEAGWGAIIPKVSTQSTWWMDTAECWDVVGQRKLFGVVTGKRNMSKVSLDWVSNIISILELSTRK